MQLQDNEYCICNYPDDTTITISKKALEEWKAHYLKVAEEYEGLPHMWGLYKGKAEVLIDLLKHFEDE